MWRFLDGVNKPAPASEKRKSDVDNYSRNYEENKRMRKYNKEWERDRPWLHDTESGMVCNICTDFSLDRSQIFVVGCSSYKLDSIHKHEKSKQHEKCRLIAEAKSKNDANSEAGIMLHKMNSEIIAKLDKMFRNCHGLVLKNRPFTDFLWLCDLDEAKGLSIGKTYRNTESAKIFVKAIADVEMSKVKDMIEQATFLCVIGDGSTDSSVKEQEMWYVRFVINGEIFVKFIGVYCAEKANAENIVSGLKETVTEYLQLEWESFVSKLAVLSCDGASVMLGCRAGVGKLLQTEQPSLISIHCMAHRLELALKDASKTIKLYEKSVMILLMGIYYFYHNSPLNRSMLIRSYKALSGKASSEHLRMPTRVGGTRWVGHTMNAVINLTSSYPYIVQHLGQLTESTERVSVDSKAKAVAFQKLLHSKDIVCFLHFMLDVLLPLKRLSMILQTKTCVIAKQHTEISSTLEVIRKLKYSDGPQLRKVIDISDIDGINLTHVAVCEFQAAKVKFLDQTEKELMKRFNEFNATDSQTVISSTKIADILSWPKSWELLKDYGDEEVQKLTQHFENLLLRGGKDFNAIEMEWLLLKKQLFDMYFSKDKDVPDWKEINSQMVGFSNILSLIDLILTLSPSSAEAERGFSQLKLIKTSNRSKLKQELLNHCLAIRLHSPEITKFDPLPAIEIWNNSGKRSRRPTFKDVPVAETFNDALFEVTTEDTEDEDHYDSDEEEDFVFEQLLKI